MNQSDTRAGIDWPLAQAMLAREQARFTQTHPRSQALAEQGKEHMLFGVPMHWMRDWSAPFAPTIASARGAHLQDVDGHDYIDFCLGDTAAMFGHSPEPVAQAIARQSGYSAMLPSLDATWVAAELARRFGLPYWQFALSASDANRFVLRWLRAATGRSKVLVFNGCYHGTVDDTLVDLIDGQACQRDSLLGQIHDLTRHTRVIEFNDLTALAAALADGEVACVLAEPAMTNIGMVLPHDGYWAAACEIIRRHGSLLVLDETHTISSGPGGYARAHGITPDALVLGKPLAGGLPCAVYGLSSQLAQRVEQAKRNAPPGHSGIGTTLSGNMFTMAALRANLEHVMLDAAYQHMFARATQLAGGLRAIIAAHGLPWCVTQLGARTEFQFCAMPPLNGSVAAAGQDAELEAIIHLYLMNRGLLITPFHNMLLTCPATSVADVAQLLTVFGQCVAALCALGS